MPPDLEELLKELSKKYPRRMTRRAAAEAVTREFFEVQPRSLERWPLGWRRVNGKAHAETPELFTVAAAKLADAAPIRGGRHAAGRPDAACGTSYAYRGNAAANSPRAEPLPTASATPPRQPSEPQSARTRT